MKIQIVLVLTVIITVIVFLSKFIVNSVKIHIYNKQAEKILSEKLSEENVEKILDTKDDEKQIIVEIVKQKYYKSKNHDRYLKYQKENPNKKAKQIVEDVNCNVDYQYYSNVVDADLKKEYLVLVNKYYKLPNDYVPKDLVKVKSVHGDGRYVNKNVYEQFVKMYDAIKKENMSIYIASPYRSYNYQENLYSNYVSKNGKEKADTFSARAGYSEHQTGLAMDISNGKISYTKFEETSEYKWMLDNAYKYGFILRYPKNKEKQTGYMFESWHFRYVGVEAAKYINNSGITFDEYYEFFIK